MNEPKQVVEEFRSKFIWDDDEEEFVIRNEHSRGPFVGTRKAEPEDFEEYILSVYQRGVDSENERCWRMKSPVINLDDASKNCTVCGYDHDHINKWNEDTYILSHQSWRLDKKLNHKCLNSPKEEGK